MYVVSCHPEPETKSTQPSTTTPTPPRKVNYTPPARQGTLTNDARGFARVRAEIAVLEDHPGAAVVVVEILVVAEGAAAVAAALAALRGTADESGRAGGVPADSKHKVAAP